MSDVKLVTAGADILLDDRIRGFPAGHPPLVLGIVGLQGWKPFDGRMSLPLISIDRTAFAANTALMMRYVKGRGVEIAPHAKTPMSPALAGELLSAGAWAITVADIRQASVMLKAGFRRLIIANEIGGPAAALRLARLLSSYPDAEVHVFADSPELVSALGAAWSTIDGLPRLGILVELGVARGGARSLEAANAVLDAALAREKPNLQVTGVAAYEGAAATADPGETENRIRYLMGVTASFLPEVRSRVGSERPLIVTAGGSVFFDMVVDGLQSALRVDGNATLVLRSGAIFFHDHGVYERGLEALDSRSGFVIDGARVSAAAGFRPVLRVWAEVLSCNEPGLAVCGMGLRDVAMDQGLPRPLALYRDGRHHRMLEGQTVTKLNDQHAFLTLSELDDVRIGDVVEFGISHPCTCLDRHAVVYGLDPDHTVIAAFPTSFG